MASSSGPPQHPEPPTLAYSPCGLHQPQWAEAPRGRLLPPEEGDEGEDASLGGGGRVRQALESNSPLARAERPTRELRSVQSGSIGTAWSLVPAGGQSRGHWISAAWTTHTTGGSLYRTTYNYPPRITLM